MTMLVLSCSRPLCRLGAARTFALALAVGATLLAGCSDKKKDNAATPTAAKVTKEEITVHQINFILAQQASWRPSRRHPPAAPCSSV